MHALLPAGPEGERHRIYLSPASLVVVPPPLVAHWQHQIRAHVARQGAGAEPLRVLVYDVERERLLRAG